MNAEPRKLRDPDFVKAEEALQRAAEKARELSRQTNTPFIVLRDGKIVDLNAEERELKARKKGEDAA